MTTEYKKTEHILLIPDFHANERIDIALAKLMPEFSRTQIKDWIDSGKVLVNGKTCKAKNKLKGGENVSVDAILKLQPQYEAEPIPLTIVYEDDAIIIINKPVGLVVHPGAGNANRTLLNALLHHAPELHILPRAGIVHRLDKDTSGLLVIGKTPAAVRHLSLQIKKHSVLREYQAIVCGRFISGGKVEAPIARHPLQRKRMSVQEDGKPALTHYRVMEKYRAHTRLSLKLETGRTHQIRVHMAHIRHPIVGDAVYGGRIQLTKKMTPELIHSIRHFKRQALHACGLALTHPVTEELMHWEIELPEDMKLFIAALQEDVIRNK